MATRRQIECGSETRHLNRYIGFLLDTSEALVRCLERDEEALEILTIASGQVQPNPRNRCIS